MCCHPLDELMRRENIFTKYLSSCSDSLCWRMRHQRFIYFQFVFCFFPTFNSTSNYNNRFLSFIGNNMTSEKLCVITTSINGSDKECQCEINNRGKQTQTLHSKRLEFFNLIKMIWIQTVWLMCVVDMFCS